MDNDHGLTRVPDRAAALPLLARILRPEPFRTYPDDVLIAIRIFQAARADAERPLSAAGRHLFALAVAVIAEHSDIQAQVDAAPAAHE